MNLLQKFTKSAASAFGWSPYESVNPSPVRQRLPAAAPQDHRKEATPLVRNELIKGSRYLMKNSGFAREMVFDMAVYSVGDGLKIQPKTEDREWIAGALDYWEEWSNQCEVTGRFSLSECEMLICRAIDEDGDIFVHLTRVEGRPVIQLIESHRVSGGNNDGTVDGIRFDGYGRPVSYNVKQDDGTFIELPAYSVLHIFDPERASSARGVPSLAHSINHIRDEMELLALEKHALKDHADKSFAITTQNGEIDSNDGFGGLDIDSGKAEDNPHSDPTALQKIVGGKWVALKPGEELKPFESNRPSPTFTGFLDHLRRDSALGVVPYEFTADSSKIGGAGVRMVVAKADRRFSHRQNILIRRFLTPLWKFVIGDAITRGEIPLIAGWWKISVVTPRRVTVDAGRESLQNREDVKAGLKTLSDHFAELGMDFEEEAERRARDIAHLQELAKKYDIPLQMLFASGVATPPVEAPTGPAK
jgi:lambda family phage portal protein